ncbi:MAG TPA: class I SAM-dependent methyltransferase [Terriglobales bacterium]|jgi:2-polyprenyl-3-methyl-5-hydroxy-6-metoxy-1,4-benzoquinol methylase|nr:class I SAM-dependent methyltransferase [Terriglobales bacterium]
MTAAEQQHFDRFAHNYEQVLDDAVALSGEKGEYFTSVKAQYLRRMLGADFRGRVLDYGCGVGLLAGLIRACLPGTRVDGFDVSRQSIDRIAPELQTQGIFTDRAEMIGRGYDGIVVSNVLHHVPVGEREALVRNLAGRLAERGRLVIFEHNPMNPLTRWVVKHCAFDDDAILLWPGEPRGYFRAAGLRLVRRDYLVFFPRLLSGLRRLEPGLRWLPLGAQYASVGERHG